jgi:predicted SAM-dependent methyltransferase
MLNTQNFCPVCLSSSCIGEFFGSSQTYTDAININLKVSICGECGSFYLKNYVKENEIGSYYPQSYYTKSNNVGVNSFRCRVRRSAHTIFKGYPIDKKISLTILFISIVYGIIFWHRLRRFPRHIKKDSQATALEIGYGGGSYLLDLNNMGWRCSGIDVDQSNSKEISGYGISVATNFAELDILKNSIDYIYSYHAFEHIYDIDTIFKECLTALSDNGTFKLCVPISDGFLPRFFKRYWYDLGIPIHKQIFSVAGIHSLAERHGFKVSKYKYNSYSQSFVGSIIASLLGLFGSDKAAQSFTHNRLFKMTCLLVSPVVSVLDIIGLGDRVEFLLTKK